MRAIIDHIDTETLGKLPTFWERLGWLFGIHREVLHTLTMQMIATKPVMSGMVLRDKTGRHKWLVLDCIAWKGNYYRVLVKNIKPMNGSDWAIYWTLKCEGQWVEFK